MPAAHVADSPVPGEVVRVQDRGDIVVGFGRHRRLEDGALAGVSVKVSHPSAAVQPGDPGLAGTDRVVEMAQGVPAERRAGHAGEGTQGLLVVRPQQAGRRGMDLPAVGVADEHVAFFEWPENPGERGWIS